MFRLCIQSLSLLINYILQKEGRKEGRKNKIIGFVFGGNKRKWIVELLEEEAIPSHRDQMV